MLSNFHEVDKPLLQSFLLGQPGFRDTLQSPEMLQLRQRVIASYHLGPLDHAETMLYILHRLKTAGWQGSPSFSEGAFDAIFQFTAGVPRRINTLCDRILLFGYLEERPHLGSSAVQEVISDLRQEVHYQSSSQEPPPIDGGAVRGSSPDNALMDRMDGRMVAIERSISRLIPLVRKVLYTLTSGKENE